MESPLEALLWETRRLFRAAAQAADAALEPLGLNASDRALLEFLAREEAPISLSALARKRSVSRQHIHQTLARLPHPEWVTRAPDPTDARSLQLSLSPAGRAAWRKIRSVDRALLRRIEMQLDASALRASAETLRSVRALLDPAVETRR
jgi:DNA-binding MarR family transcriptional regulator